MNNKEELKKQLIILSLILVLVIIVAIILNTGKNKDPNLKKYISMMHEILFKYIFIRNI